MSRLRNQTTGGRRSQVLKRTANPLRIARMTSPTLTLSYPEFTKKFIATHTSQITCEIDLGKSKQVENRFLEFQFFELNSQSNIGPSKLINHLSKRFTVTYYFFNNKRFQLFFNLGTFAI